MAITSGFFDSISGDRKYNAEQMSNYFDGLISNGIYENIGDKFVVTTGTGMTVNVGTGRAIINCHWIKNDATASFTLDPADVQLSRIDAIVLRLDKRENARNINIVVKKGTAAQNPTTPSITRTDDVYELYLATVKVNKNVTSIVQSNIIDWRSTNYCGWVTGLIKQVDTSTLFLQWQNAYEQQFADFDDYMNEKKEEFNEWFATLTKELKVEASLVKFQNTVHTNGYLLEIKIGISEYDSSEDVLLTFVNGVFFVEGDEYIVSGSGANAKIIMAKDLKGENDVTFIVLKNVIGKSVLIGTSQVNANGLDDEYINGQATYEEVE